LTPANAEVRALPTILPTLVLPTTILPTGASTSATTCSYRGTTIACNDPALGWWNSTDS
jgi:hypothetical protein